MTISAKSHVVAASDRAIRDVLVIGGGLAGMSSACALAQAGFRVQLLERRPYLGGRASSYNHPGTAETIDNCQHVLLGCCTNLRNFYERIGVESKIEWTDCITFVEPGGRRSVLKPNGLPAPLHSAMSFLKAPMLEWSDKVSIGRAMRQLAAGPLAEGAGSFGDWLRQHKQSVTAWEHFWRPIILSALNDEPDDVSRAYGSQVFYESMLKSAQAGYMGLSSVPLGELYENARAFLQANKGSLHLRASVEHVAYDTATGRWTAQTLDEQYEADAIVFAVPFQAMQKLLAEVRSMADATALQRLSGQLAKLRPSPITSVHLWLDRAITDLPHAALLDSPLHWMFQKSRIQPGTRATTQGSYLELVISASCSMVNMTRQQVLDLAVQELAQFFPTMHDAKVLKSAVIKEVNATFRVPPGVDALRPRSIGPWPRSFLAGDWTATGWPSTMEGAVRSGYLAAEALCSVSARTDKFVQEDLPETGLIQFLSRVPGNKPVKGYS